MASVIIEEQVRVPLDLRGLADFRRWAQSDQFPEQGRIDYIDGDIEVDMSPEDLFAHGTLKGKIYAVLLQRVEQLDMGYLFTDSTRVSHVEAQLSVEPDIVLISFAALDENRVRLVPKAGDAADRYVEIEGTPDLVVEIVSDSSQKKDTQRLYKAYHQAGVPEYWVVDARGAELRFRICRAGKDGYEPVPIDDGGFQPADVMGCRYRLARNRGHRGHWQYSLHSHAANTPE